MEIIYLLVVVLSAVTIGALAEKWHLQPHITVLIIFGILSFVPNLPNIVIEPYALIEIVLPPILFSSARNLSTFKFMQLRSNIISLGIGLVTVTAFAVAIIFNIVVPTMPFAAALLIGATVAPPDAISAVAIGKKLHLPSKIMSVLTGESLINDSIALTLFSFAASQLYNHETFISSPVLLMIYTTVTGIIVGVVFGFITNSIRNLFINPSFVTVFTLIIPFFIFFISEIVFHASGVMAVVFGAFVVEKASIHSDYDTRIQERNLWRSVDSLLEIFVFAYMGLQIHQTILDQAFGKFTSIYALVVGLLVVAVLLVVRFAWIYSWHYISNFIFKIYKKKTKKPSFIKKANPIRKFTTGENLLVSWAGMRGVVTLAAAASIPAVIEGQTEFFDGNFIKFVAMFVVLFTLIVQGNTLPILMKKIIKFNPKNKAYLQKEYKKAQQIMVSAVRRAVKILEKSSKGGVDTNYLKYVWDQYQRLDNIYGDGKDEFVDEFLQDVVEGQRLALIDALNTEELDPDVAKQFLRRLDHREAGIALSPYNNKKIR
ncbi:MAG: sodium:proton antiporter [Bifidobacteriaceae bacterium]|jgi:CPA1 family monovalent cation:H+ antiporter|nr:sodium:proton antiporter [Bifidobacteriaceae bacterium]